MKKLVIGLFFVFTFLVMVNSFVIAEEGSNSSGSSSDSSTESSNSESSNTETEVEVKTKTEEKNGEIRIKEERRIKAKDGEIREKNEFRARLSDDQKRMILQEKNRLRIKNATECPVNCSCSGSTMKCMVNGTREMTIHAGNSGNVIIQTKRVNASTTVELYKENGTLYGRFGNETRPIKVLPDEVKMKIRERIKAKLENESMDLNEEGEYEVKVKKKARLFFIIPVDENLEADVDAETGTIIVIKKPWWGFMARDLPETEEVEVESEVETTAENTTNTSAESNTTTNTSA